MLLFDSHCHLQDERISGDIDNIINRALRAGVHGILCCGSSEEDWEETLELTRKYDLLIPAFGIHPWYVGKRSVNWLSKLEKVLKENPQAAVGEIGLDHALEKRDDVDQAEVFREQIRLAVRLKRPVSIHCRRAWGDLLTILKGERGVPFGGAIHSWSGSPELVEQIQSLGLSISFSGSVTHERNHRAQNSVLRVAADRLLVETDSPDLAPVGVMGKNEPCNIVSVVRKIASLRDVTPEELGEITFDNGIRLFGRDRGQS